MHAIFWLIVAITLFVIETTTYQMVCIWFSISAMFTTIVAAFGAPFWLQLTVFLLGAIVVLWIGRPLVRDKIRVRKRPTNADRVIGQIGVVQQEVDNDLQTGRVLANGLSWTARSEEGEIIPAGEKVCALRIDGVKLIVKPLEISEHSTQTTGIGRK